MSYYNAIPQNRSYQNRPRRAATPNANPQTIAAWALAHPAEWNWLQLQRIADNDFACSLLGWLNRKGSLTDNQIAAVRRNIERDAVRPMVEAARAAAAPEASSPALERAFESAKAAGHKAPKMRFAGFQFSPAPVTGKNPGAIYVKDREDGRYMGKVHNGKFLGSRECNAEIQSDILNVLLDPQAAAIAYGKKFGICSCCGRELTDPASVALGIGPVCNKNFGWAK